MKKIIRSILVAVAVATTSFTPVAVFAQTDPIIIETPADPTLPSTGASTPTTPDSGIAPPNSKLAQNTAVFVGGSLLGAGLGLGVITLRKKRTQN